LHILEGEHETRRLIALEQGKLEDSAMPDVTEQDYQSLVKAYLFDTAIQLDMSADYPSLITHLKGTGCEIKHYRQSFKKLRVFFQIDSSFGHLPAASPALSIVVPGQAKHAGIETFVSTFSASTTIHYRRRPLVCQKGTEIVIREPRVGGLDDSTHYASASGAI
jgi:hypothetical protein